MPPGKFVAGFDQRNCFIKCITILLFLAAAAVLASIMTVITVTFTLMLIFIMIVLLSHGRILQRLEA